MKYLDKESVIRALRQRHAEGCPLFCTVVQKEDRRLMNAAFRLFGSWKEAKRLALGEAIREDHPHMIGELSRTGGKPRP